MTQLARIFEGLLLVLAGGFMLGLIITGNYWSYLNPAFMPLTGAAGAGLVLTGLALPFDKGVRPGASRIVVMAVLLALTATSAYDILQQRKEADLFFSGEKEEEGPSRIEWRGQEYVRINTAELAMLADTLPATAPRRFAVRGVVTRGGELGPAGLTALVRTSVVCCLADAMAMGFLLRGEAVEDLPSGAWAEVLGELAPMPPALSGGYAVRIPGSILTVLDDEYVLRVERAKVVDPPAVPYIFEFRKEEPFAY